MWWVFFFLIDYLLEERKFSESILWEEFTSLYSIFFFFCLAFDGIFHKNRISWNSWLKWLFRSGQIERAGCLFDEIPVRDVTWKMIISGYFRHALITGSNTTLPKFVIRRVQIILFYFKELFWKKKKKIL
jgi:pentatricopeptide repeat protein